MKRIGNKIVKKIGFIIVNDNEEFLMDYQGQGGVASYQWSRIPDLSQIFYTQNQATRIVKKMEDSYQLWVLGLYETEENLFVVFPCEENGHDDLQVNK